MENRCVCCGVIIPEGMMVCKTCEIEAENRLTLKRKTVCQEVRNSRVKEEGSSRGGGQRERLEA